VRSHLSPRQISINSRLQRPLERNSNEHLIDFNPSPAGNRRAPRGRSAPPKRDRERSHPRDSYRTLPRRRSVSRGTSARKPDFGRVRAAHLRDRKDRSVVLHSLDHTLGADVVDEIIDAAEQTAKEHVAQMLKSKEVQL
jgi:hypothetical protein